MIPPNDLAAMRERLTLAGEAARKIIDAPTVVYFNEEDYWPTRSSLMLLADDISRVLMELDFLRVLFQEKTDSFLQRSMDNVGRTVGQVSVGGEAISGGDSVGQDAAATGSGVPAGGVPPQAGSSDRPVTRRNRKRVQAPAPEVVIPDTASEVGGTPENIVG